MHDEPQHIYQGEITLKLLEDLGISSYIVGTETTESELRNTMCSYREKLAKGLDVAFVIRKGALSYDKKVAYCNDHTLLREEIIEHIVDATGDDFIVSTTGKASRELFEIRERRGQGHGHDFLTVGSMGHSSSIALGIALQKRDRRVWCIDGDGAALMHMGAMAVIGANRPQNMIHVVINNTAHETVGGMPTVAGDIDLVQIARGCGYPYTASVDNMKDLRSELMRIKERGELCFLEVKSAIGSRSDLGRPTTTARQNKNAFETELGR